MPDARGVPRPGLRRAGVACLLAACLLPTPAPAQERTGYLLGEDQGLEMLVHIIGEVQKPGEYRVRDQTDLLELLAKAGGPTQFSRLSSVMVRRSVMLPSAASSLPREPASQIEILHVNLEECLRNRNAAPPQLKPGDVVLVPKNAWHRWKDVSAIIRDVSVVASAYFLYLRATRD